MNGISDLLQRYGTSLEETRALMPQLTEAVRQRRVVRPPALPQAPQFFTPEEARQFGVELEPDWTLKVTPGQDGAEPSISYISPEKWEITQDQMYISPEGKRYTKEQMEAQLAAPEIPLEVEQVFGRLYPSDEFIPDVQTILRWAEEKPDEFLEDIWGRGRTEDTEAVLKMMFPEITPEQLDEFFAPMAEEEPELPWLQMPSLEMYKEAPWYMKYTPLALLSAPGIISPKVQHYFSQALYTIFEKVTVPWETFTLFTMSRPVTAPERLAHLSDDEIRKHQREGSFPQALTVEQIRAGATVQMPDPEIAQRVRDILSDAQKKYGPIGMYFSKEAAQAWQLAHEQAPEKQRTIMTVLEWTNPAFFVPIGTGFGVAARFTSKIPLIGRSLRYTAAGVQGVERGIVEATLLPTAVRLGTKGVERLGVRLGEVAANRLIKQAEHLEALMDLPASERILAGVLVDNWMKRALTIASKVPVLRAGIEKGLGWRILTKRQSQAIEDIVGRGAVIHAEVARRGINAKAVKLWELRAIEMNPIRLFGFNKKAFSPKMYERLLPEYAAEKEFAGTLEHVFTKPEMYRLTPKQTEYVTKVHEINTEILNLLKKEGVAPEHVTQDWWIHRVVTGKFDPEGELIALRGRPGVRGRGRVGAKPSYEMHRKAPTMAEGIAWGVQYERNPELAITTYIEEAFRKIADARLEKYVAEFGVLPSERLAERFPEIVERAALTKTELADAAKFGSLINRAIRGEKLPEGTLRAIERRFPDLGRRFRALVQEPVRAEKQLRELLAQNEKVIRDLQARLKKAEAVDIEAIKAELRAEVARGIPDKHKLSEAFKLMDYDDRLAFRNTMDSQLDEIGRILYEQESELATITEFLKTDAVALYHGTIRGKRVPLTSVLVRGEFPETFSIEEARMLMMGKAPKTVVKGRVPRSVVADELADHFKMTEQQLIDHIEFIRTQRTTAKDLRYLVNYAGNRQNNIKRMLGVLDDVDSTATYIPKAEPGMPEAGVQKDMFGYETPVFPKGKGQVTQISMDDYAKLVEHWRKAGLPDDALPVAIKPKIEGVKGLEAETQAAKVAYEVPAMKPAAERKAGLEALRSEVKALTEVRKAPYWKAKAERAFRMEQVRQPDIGEGYIMQPFAGGRIYEREFIDSFNRFFGHDAGLGVLKVTSDVAGILRITKAALDFSAMAIQGLPSWGLAHAYLMFNPLVGVKLMGGWYKAFFQSTRAFFDPSVVAGFLTKNKGIAIQRLAMGGSSRAVDYFQALTVRTGIGGKAEWLMEKIPLKPYHRAETSFYSAGEMVRDEFWRVLSPKAIARGQEFELARILDRITGIVDPASLGVPLTVRQLEQSFVWFAPSYTRACLTVVADIFRGGYTGAEVRKAIGGMITAGAVMYSGVQYAMAVTEGKSDEEAWEAVKEGFCVYEDPITGEVEWKPSARFMTLRVGNYNFGFGGFWYGLLRLAGNISACVNEVGERETIDLVRIMKNGSFNKKDNPFIYWWYSRSSPFFGSAFELASGKDFLGYPIEGMEEYMKHIVTRFEPIWAEQGLNWMIPGMARNNEVPEGLARQALIPAELFGLRTFPESTWTGFYDKVNEYIKRIPLEELDDKQREAWREGKLEWRHLTEMQKANLLSRYPDLEELYGEAQADSAVRSSPNWAAWRGRMDEEREIYYKRISDLTEQLIRGEIDTREYREKAGEAGQNYGSILEAIERDPNYAVIYDFFDKKEAEGDKYGFRDDVALGEFQAQIIYTEDLIDSKGDYNWDERDRRVDAFIEKWGQDTYDRIQQYLQEKKGLKDLSEVWIRKASDTEKLGRGYWRLPYKPIIDMDEEDEAEGNIPAEYQALWKQYQELETDAERDAFLESHPDMAKDWRAEYRKDNPEDDARLALWGYGGKLQTREAYDLVTQWGRELGVPLEQMGLGLPPRSLIDQYFDYGDIIREFGGNSPEAKLYRVKQYNWDEWAQENWGWKPLGEDFLDIAEKSFSWAVAVQWRELEDKYDAFSEDERKAFWEQAQQEYSEYKRAGTQYLLTHDALHYALDRRAREAAELGLARYAMEKLGEPMSLWNSLSQSYVDWHLTSRAGYEDDWFLMENKEFYQAMIDLDLWQPRDFSKVPTKEVYELYKTYQGLPTGTPRLNYRKANPTLEEWGILAGKWKPLAGRGEIEEKKSPWQEAEEIERFKEKF